MRLLEVLDATSGLLRFEATSDLESGSTFGLRFATSPQETALVNVRGDGGSFDLLTVEAEAGPSGEYTSTFVADDEILMEMHSSASDLLPSIMHEQHNIPAGLRGNVVIDDERIRLPGSVEAGGTFMVKVKNPPIRLEDPTTGMIAEVPAGATDRNIDINTRGVTVVGGTISEDDARAGRLNLETVDALDTGDEIEVSYRGSDSFEITLRHRPAADDTIDASDFVVPSNTSDPADFGAYFAIVGQDDADPRKVRIGVSFGGGDDDDDYSKSLPGHLTVLGVSYEGVERITVPRDIEGIGTADFTFVLEFAPRNADGNKDSTGDDIIDEDDIYVVSSSNRSVTQGVGSASRLEFTVNGTSLTIDPEEDLTAGDTIDIAYAVDVGMNPRNALLPHKTEVADRPVIRVGKGSRVTITSDDDRTTVDAGGGRADLRQRLSRQRQRHHGPGAGAVHRNHRRPGRRRYRHHMVPGERQ